MDLFLLHFVLLTWFSAGAVARWVHTPAERLLAGVAVAWANLIATQFILSWFHGIGPAAVFLGLSLAIAVAVLCLAWLRPVNAATAQPDEPPVSRWLSIPALLTLPVLAAGSAWAAAQYLPSTPAALAYALPRSLLQIGNGSILPLQTSDARQVLLPFNHGLLHTWALLYRVPLQTIGFFNVAAWCLAGVAIYRLCRVVGWGANVSLAAAWGGLVSTPVLAQAATSESGLPAASALVAALGFLLDWRKNPRVAPAAFGGLLAGLAAGSSVGTLLLVLALGLGAWWSGAIPRKNRGVVASGLVFGILPCAANLALSFGHGFGVRFASLLHSRDGGDTFLTPHLLMPLWRKPDVLHGPTEETVGLGLTGLLCFAAALLCVGARRRYGRTAFALGLAAVGWVALLSVAARWFTIDPDQLVVAIFLAAPLIAAVLSHANCSRLTCVGIGVPFALAGLWSAYLYLGGNAQRPLAPLISPPTTAAPRPSPIPQLLDYRLSLESRVNFSSDGEDDLLLVLMARQQTQRYSTRNTVAPDAYNIISRASLSRNRPVRELPQRPAYVLIPFDGKPTAGVEFLGTIGRGPLSRDYLGVSGDANNRTPIATNHTVLVIVDCLDSSPSTMSLRATVAGLNPQDNARLEIWGIAAGGERIHLAQLEGQGEHSFASPTNLRQIILQLRSRDDGRELGSGVLGDSRTPFESDDVPTSPDALFHTQLVSNPPGERLTVSPGLTAPEGPFPQWDLPVIRWARAEKFAVRVPAIRDLARIRLSFSARLHLRPKATMEVLGNGRRLRLIDFDDPTTWHQVTLSFPAQPGENVIEFRDAEVPPEPDWAGYLERYPDVKRYIESKHQLPKEGALEHYHYSGKAEGRLMDFLPVPKLAPDAYFFMFRSLRVEGLPR